MLIAAVLLVPRLIWAAEEEAGEHGRPNFLVILADDMGFSDAGAYGGEIDTPHLDRLAAEGLRFTQFSSTGRCWPSRAALLTGYYPQQVGMDPRRSELDSLPSWGALMPGYLEPLGYRTYHSGKWHIFLEPRAVADGGFDRSYVVRDHNRFFYPRRHDLDDEQLPAVDPGEDFYTTTAIADRAIEFLDEHEQQHSEKPWLTYLAFTTPHFPLHALEEDIAKYRGRYDAGWDEIRRRRLERMKEIGIVDEGVELPPLQPEVVPAWNMWSEPLADVLGAKDERTGPGWVNRSLREVYGPGEVGRAVPWESLTQRQQRFQARKMEIHAAMVDRMDREIGRVLRQIEEMGDRENTVVLFMSDNGASAELIVRGDGHDREAPMGSADSYLCLGPGWSTASNTPLRLHKHWVHEGGSASPLIVSWPAGLDDEAKGGLRHTPGHFVDVLPTLLELAGAEPRPGKADGPPLAGRSLVPAFDEDRRIERPYIFFSHDGHRGLRVGDWKLVSRKRLDRWQLYNLAEDRNELDDLAEQHPEKRDAMIDRWHRLNKKFESQALSRKR